MQLGAERALLLGCRGLALGVQRRGDLGAHLVPDAFVARGGEHAELHRAVWARPGSQRSPAAPRSTSTRMSKPLGHRDAQRAEVDARQLVVRLVPLVVGPGRRLRLLARPASPTAASRRSWTRRCASACVVPALAPIPPLSGAATSAAAPPVEPWPPAPRSEARQRVDLHESARSTRCTTSWAIRSPRERRSGRAESWLMTITLISPRYPASIVPGALTSPSPARAAKPGARVHERRVAVGQGDRDTGRQHRALPGAEGRRRQRSRCRHRRRPAARTAAAAPRIEPLDRAPAGHRSPEPLRPPELRSSRGLRLPSTPWTHRSDGTARRDCPRCMYREHAAHAVVVVSRRAGCRVPCSPPSSTSPASHLTDWIPFGTLLPLSVAIVWSLGRGRLEDQRRRAAHPRRPPAAAST